MDAAARTRKIRQLLDIDRLLGADQVPLGRAPELPGPPASAGGSSPTHPPSPTSQPPSSSLIPSMQNQPTIAASTLTTKQKIAALEALRDEVAAFLTEHWPRDGWNTPVFGEGDPDADLMFIGEAPGADEDRLGRPFVGRAGQLLDKQIEAMTLRREQVYIANIGKARPPSNRVPTPEEADRMMPFLLRQIQIISPKVIVALGATSAKYLLNNPKLAITRERGAWRDFHGIDLMPTFHPAYLLRQYTKENRARVWDDLQAVMKRLGIKPPKK